MRIRSLDGSQDLCLHPRTVASKGLTVNNLRRGREGHALVMIAEFHNQNHSQNKLSNYIIECAIVEYLSR